MDTDDADINTAHEGMFADQLTAYFEIISNWQDTLNLGIPPVTDYVWSFNINKA